jgi:phosphatidylglycerol:prolipoprotein diacylglycerol transferase
MHPRLLEIPILHLTIWSFGLMMVVGFLTALFLVRCLSRRAGLDPETMSSAALHALIIGTVGARVFFVVHHFDEFRAAPLSTFAIWRGGLEFLGGVVPAVLFLLVYLRRRKLPVRRYLDIMAIGLMAGLTFGRIGCFLNGCCYGKPTDLPWAVRFPYGSYAYLSQIYADPARDRARPHLDLPRSEYFLFSQEDLRWHLKPFAALTQRQQYEVTEGHHRCLPVHPTQLYASGHALLLCAILYLLWRRTLKPAVAGGKHPLRGQPGLAIAGILILYGVGRFILEALRDDNPYEVGALTISQILGLAMSFAGLVFLLTLRSIKQDTCD